MNLAAGSTCDFFYARHINDKPGNVDPYVFLLGIQKTLLLIMSIFMPAYGCPDYIYNIPLKLFLYQLSGSFVLIKQNSIL